MLLIKKCLIHPALETQSPDAKEPTNILDAEQWSHRAVGREEEEKTQIQQWDHSVTHHRHTLMMSEHFLQNVTWWNRKETVLHCRGDFWTYFEAFLGGMSTQYLYLAGSITWTVCTSWPSAVPPKCVGQTGNSWCRPHYFHGSWGFSCTPRILSCCFYPPSPFLQEGIYFLWRSNGGS